MPFFLLRYGRELSFIFILGTVFLLCKDVFFPVIKNTGEIINNQQHQKVQEASYRATTLIREFRTNEVDKVFVGEIRKGDQK